MSLWDEARDSFVKQLRERDEDPLLIEQFLKDTATLDRARRGAAELRDDSERKYGAKENNNHRNKGISRKWIGRIMRNLDKLVTFGNVAKAAAPESVGLVWFAVSLVLGAILNDYKLYESFQAALYDITDMMVLVSTYHKLYQDQTIEEENSIYHELFDNIREIYLSILDFSYAVKKHITGGKLLKIVHAAKHTVGASNRQFEEKAEAIANRKITIIRCAGAAFQQRSTHQLDDVSGKLSVLSDGLDFLKQSSDEWNEIWRDLKYYKALRPQDVAEHDFEKILELLKPSLDENATTADEYEPGTCTWINEVPAYVAWQNSTDSAVLCITGEAGSGKSVLGAFISKAKLNQTAEIRTA